MNVFDFDNTLLRGDSSARFFAYCLARRPRMWRDIPGQAVNALLFVCKRRDKRAFKQRLFHFLTLIGDVDAAVEAFWRRNLPRLKAWYPPRHRDDDVVVSASPEFLIRPACTYLGIRCVIGSPVDKRSGTFLGPNCQGAEKVNRFRARFPGQGIDEFFSDSHADDPLAALAKRAWLVKGERLEAWDGRE
ncbi:MAG: haloacid dehalogenase-like hydrolase [Clostridia bacterium]|nr:haloacid dehalogenase-like hydrolase [Clostridia bacterium]MBR6890845.1 haloacid dehalogenase-like hydrolase [Clostridia bacterium]